MKIIFNINSLFVKNTLNRVEFKLIKIILGTFDDHIILFKKNGDNQALACRCRYNGAD